MCLYRVVMVNMLLTTGVLLLPSVIAVYKDVVVVLDRSGSVMESDFDEAVDFVYNVTEWLTIGPNGIQMSVFTFSSSSNEIFELSYYTNRTLLLKAIKNLRGTRTSGGTNTFYAIDYIRENSFTSSKGGRLNASRAVVILTDGLSSDINRTIMAADMLRNETGADVFAVGIGSTVSNSNDELEGIASDPDSYYVHYVDTFVYLCHLVPALVPKLDSSINATAIADCPSTPIPRNSTTTWRSSTVTYSTVGTTSPGMLQLLSVSGSRGVSASRTNSETGDNGLLIGAVAAAILAAIATAAITVGVLRWKKRSLKDEDSTVLAAVRSYGDTRMGEKKPVFSLDFA